MQAAIPLDIDISVMDKSVDFPTPIFGLIFKRVILLIMTMSWNLAER